MPPELCVLLEPGMPLELCVPPEPCVPKAFCMAEELCAAEERPFAVAVGGAEEPLVLVPDVPKRGDTVPPRWPPPWV